ncbi:MAG: hypothetical protein NC548_37595 [Lachnospiraceae bacterium]|nr:hypothetical protein [Lachnospiraceae bacterium]MCM1236357.1 hypothetical protein [Ruminococcus flavefaciens]
MKLRRLKKVIVAMSMASMLSLCMLPYTVQAKTIAIGNKTVSVSLSGSSSKVTAVTSYTQGPGSVAVSVTGYACDKTDASKTKPVSASAGPNSTPTGVSASVSAPSGYRFYSASSVHTYTVDGASGTYRDSINL